MHEEFLASRMTFRLCWAKYGVMAREFAKEELFKMLGFASMKAYLKSLPDVCYSTVHDAMKRAMNFPDWGEEELSQFPKENLRIIENLPERQRMSKSVLEMAKNLTAKELRVKLNQKHSTHLEGRERIIFDVDVSAVKVIEAAIDDMVDRIEKASPDATVTRGMALEALCIGHLQKVGNA